MAYFIRIKSIEFLTIKTLAIRCQLPQTERNQIYWPPYQIYNANSTFFHENSEIKFTVQHATENWLNYLQLWCFMRHFIPLLILINVTQPKVL